MENKEFPDVGSAVRQIRIDKGMTIEALSRITKIRIEELNSLEQGGNCPVPDYFHDLNRIELRIGIRSSTSCSTARPR